MSERESELNKTLATGMDPRLGRKLMDLLPEQQHPLPGGVRGPALSPSIFPQTQTTTLSDQDFKRQLDCTVLALFANNPRLDEMFRTGNLEVSVCDYSDAIFAERKKREAGE